MIYNDSKYNADWEIKPLSKLGEFRRGKSKHRPRNDKKLFINGNYPLVQTGEISAANLFIRHHSAMYNEFGLKQSKLWDTNTLCITIAANIAETALLGYSMCFPDSIVGFNAYPDECSELFMHYVFTYIKRSIQNSASGSIQDNINIDYLTSLNFRIPKKKYQDKVVEVLTALDNKIEINTLINSELEAMSKSVYDYWFVQFDFPDENGQPYKTSGGKMFWNKELKREIPDGWAVKRLVDFGEFKNGINYDPSLPGDTEAKIINVRNISSTNLFVSQYALDTISLAKENVKNYLVTENDILIARSGIPGATRMMFEFAENTIYCGFIIRFQVYSPTVKNYLFYFLKDMEASTTSKSGGTIMSNVNQETLKSMWVVEPKEDLYLKFNTFISPFFKQANTITKETEKLYVLRDWLLPMLMNGQVKLNEKAAKGKS